MLKPFDLADIDPRVVGSVTLRRCNAFTANALVDNRPYHSCELTADLIQHLSYTVEHIRRTSLLQNGLKQSFRQHQEKLRELLKSKMQPSTVSSHESPRSDTTDNRHDRELNESAAVNNLAPRDSLSAKRSILRKADSSPVEMAADQPQVVAGMKMQRLMQDQKVVLDAIILRCMR